jgi:ABC-type bacteriocin/lantibiotic exporter with double-glycine peptidase domain
MKRNHRRWLVPEVVQTSATDCGPASLKCLLEGFGIPASYGRLREACQTDVDGTSIDTMEEIAVQLGLEAEQIMVPPDYLLLEETRALPAIAVVQLPTGMTHFVLVWRKHGPLVQAASVCYRLCTYTPSSFLLIVGGSGRHRKNSSGRSAASCPTWDAPTARPCV